MVKNQLQLEVLKDEQNFVDIPEEELLWSTVTLSEVINEDCRLEASVYKIEAKHARELLQQSKFPIKNLYSDEGFVKTASYPSRFKRIYVKPEHGIPFFLPSQITELFPTADKFISPNTKTNIDELRVKKGQLLLTRSGTTGNITLVNDTLDGLVFSDDVIRIDCHKEKDNGYVYAFLKTKIGQTLISTNEYGSVVSHIEPSHLESLSILEPTKVLKNNISKFIEDSFDLRDNSNIKIKRAHSLLKKALKLDPIHTYKEADNLYYKTKLSNLDGRFEASFHNTLKRRLLTDLNKNSDQVLKVGDKKISDSIILPGRFKRFYVEEGQGVAFFGGKHLYELDPSNKKFLSKKKHKERINNELSLKENSSLITRSGTIGKVKLTPRHWEDWVINEHVIRVNPKSTDIAGYLFIWLDSDYGEHFIKSFTYGAVVDEIDDSHVSLIDIPILKEERIQDEINKLALEANELRYQAYIKEQQAIKMVNELVIHQQQ